MKILQTRSNSNIGQTQENCTNGRE